MNNEKKVLNTLNNNEVGVWVADSFSPPEN